MNSAPGNMAYLMAQALQPGYEEDLFAGEAAFAAAAVGLNSADDSLPYSTAELNAPEYSTDDFRMFSFKVARCSKRYVHDWRACPFAHPTENARRRDPRLHKYLPVPCPEYKRGICFRGDECPYSHGVYECWLHPAKYRTQLCKEGPHCRRPVCFFAHSVLDLRQPTHVWDGNNYEPQQTAASALLQAAASNGAGGSTHGGVRGAPESAFLAAQLAAQQSAAAEEALNNSGAGMSGGSSANLARAGSSDGAGGSSGGPSSPHGSGAGGRSGSPPQAATAVRSASLASAGTWSPSAQQLLLAAAAAAERQGSGEASPTTPSRAASSDAPARPSAEAGAAVAAAAALGAGAAPATPDLTTVASALAAAVAQAQQAAAASSSPATAPLAAAPGAGLPPRHSIDVGALAASSSRGNLATAGSGSLPPRMSFDLPPSGSGSSQAAAAAASQHAHRMSFDSLMQTRGSNGAAWPAGYGSGPQEMQSGTGPRMSNAVARKLGLAPQRTANEARLAKLRTAGSGGMTSPQRGSLDGLLQALHGSTRASLEQQMVNQQMLAAAGLAPMNGAPVMGGGYMAGPYPAPAGYGGAHMAADPAAMGINPALLSVVAAQMGGAVPGPMPPQGMQPQNAAAMAALVDSLHGWNLNGGAGGGMPPQGGYAGGHGGAQHLQQHRAASFDSALQQHHAAAAAAAYMHTQQAQQPPHTSPYYLPTELETMMNNNNNGSGGDPGLVHPVGAGHAGRGRE